MFRKPGTILFIILLVSVAIRFYRIDYADGKPIFDELGYYVAAANSYLVGHDDPNPQHPPLGKELIALGIAIFGNNPYGWRIPSLVFSLAGIVLIYLLAREMFDPSSRGRLRRPWRSLGQSQIATSPDERRDPRNDELNGIKRRSFIPLVSAFLLSVDTMYFVYSRLAVMDMFLTVFVLLTLIFLWRCYKRGDAKNLVLLSASFGLALATKWTALSLVPVILVFLFLRYRLGRKFFGALGLLGLLGGSIYVASYVPYLLRNSVGPRNSVGLRHSFWDVLGIQRSMVTIWENYERTKTVRYPELQDSYFISHAYSWILNLMTAYFGEPTPDMKLKAILVRFNPVVFWGGLGLLIWSVWNSFQTSFRGRRRRPWESGLVSDCHVANAPRNDGHRDRILFLVLPILCNFLPWLVVRRVQYLYYFLPSFPLMIILIAEALRHLLNKHKEVAPMLLIAAAVMFCYDFPFLVGLPTNPRLLNPLANAPVFILQVIENSTSFHIFTLP